MFIAHLSDGKTLLEQNGLTWDNIPDGISSLQLQTFSNEIITLPKCDEYFYSIEAVTTIGIGNNSQGPTLPVITAKIIGGIVGDKAIMLRADTRGHINIQYLNKSELPFKEFVYKKGN